MVTKQKLFAGVIVALVVSVFLSTVGSCPARAAGLSFRYGGQGIWPQTATANSQRWFRGEVTWDASINDDGVPNERIDGLYLSGVSFSNEIAAPSGRTYAQVLWGPKGIWTAYELVSPPTYSITIIGTGTPSLPNRLYYTGYTPPGGYGGYTLTINTGLAEDQEFTVSASGVDMWGTQYLDVVPDPTAAGVCQVLNITALDPDDATKFYYTPTVGPYAPDELVGLTIHFDTGAATGETREIESNGWDAEGYYITVTEDLPEGLQQTLTLESTVPAQNKVYYSAPEDVSYAPGSLTGQILDFVTPLVFGQHTIVDNGFDPAGDYIQVDTSLPADLLQSLTVVSQQGTTRLYYSGATHSFNQLVGAGIEFTSGAALGERRTITANYEDLTGTYIDVDADLPAGIVAGDTFQIKDLLRIEDQCHIYEQASIVDTRYAGDRPEYFGVAVDVPEASTGDNPIRILTVGPFSNYHSDYLVGSIPTTSSNPLPDFWFYLFYSTWNSDDGVYDSQDPIEVEGTHLTVPVARRLWPVGEVAESGELQAWYSGMGTGVDPLVTTRSTPGGPTDPDNGAGSDEYTFRIKYMSGLEAGATGPWPELRSAWWRYTTPYQEFGNEGCRYAASYCNFDRFAQYIMKGYGTNADPWMHDLKFRKSDRLPPGSEDRWTYTPHDDPHYDMTGDYIDLAGHDPEAILIVDGQYNRPYYMVQESGDRLRTGFVYRYIVRPTNYLQLLHNIFTLQFDQPYSDAWDVAYMTLKGEPTSNAYVSMRSGGHTYEFLTCRDWEPPVWGIGGGGSVGSYADAGPCALALRGMPGRSLDAAHVVNDNWGWGLDVHAESVELWYEDEDPAGYGYPYDSQDPTNYPKVDPVLTAHPYFEDGPLSAGERGYPWPRYMLEQLGPQAPGSLPNPFNPFADNAEPWGPLAGPTYATLVYGGYNASDPLSPYARGLSPEYFTNEDTIWPNYVNIRYETDPDYPFRGGKWTMDTTFVFRVNYWQSDNFRPQFMQVFIRQVDEDGTPLTSWQGHSMNKVYPTDNDYMDGCRYYYEASADQLPGGSGDYQYYFQASDGRHVTIYPNRPSDDPGYIGVPPGDNDYYWFRVNTKPQLADQSVTPASGTQGDDYVYQVTYYDDDGKVRTAGRQGDQPFKSILHIDLFGDAQGQAQVASVDSTTRLSYDYASAPPEGGNPYSAGSLAGMKVRMETGSAAGQQFDITANGESGGVGWIEVSGDLVAAVVAGGDQFNIADWYATTMWPEDVSDTNYRDGAIYTLNAARAGVVLDEGTHHYYFEFWDNWAYWINWQQYFMDPSAPDPIDQKVEGEMVRFPPESYFEGPEITVNRPPVLSRYYFEPPDHDTVAANPVGSTFEYTRPGGLPGYPASALDDMYLQVLSGVAQFKVYQIESNTETEITVAGGVNLAGEGLVANNPFRVFTDRDSEGFLAWGYDTDDTFEGTPATPFRLYVTYTDADNSSPSVIRVAVCDAAGAVQNRYNMTQVVPEDTAYADGALYVTIDDVYLSEGVHTLKAQASDGSLWYNDGDAGSFFGPASHEGEPAQGPDIAPNARPLLGFAVGTGEVGAVLSEVEFTYTNGASLAGNPIVAVYFEGLHDFANDCPGGGFRVQSIDHNTKTIALKSGVDLMAAGVEAGDSFTATVELDPTSGLSDTEFVYWVVYTDTDYYGGVSGNPPTFVKVFIDNQEHLMAAYSPTDTDMTDGKVYRFLTSALSASQSHSYYFIASDGLGNVRWPDAPGFFVGPTVTVNSAPIAPVYPLDDEWSPADGTRLEIQTPPLNWPDGADPDPWDPPAELTYTVQLSTDVSFGTVDYEYNATDFGGPGVSEMTVPDALDYSWWYWRVCTVDTRGLTSDWSSVLSFKVDRRPEPPTSGFSPVGDIGTLTPLLEWDEGTDPDLDDPPAEMSYHVELAEDASFADPIISPELGNGITGKGVTSFQVDAALGLENDTTYYWRVRTFNGLTSQWSATQSFTVALPVYSISGTVTDENGAPLPGVIIETYDSTDTKVAEAVTAANGTYELAALMVDTYRIVPSYDSFTFTPTETVVPLTDTSVTDVDFELVPGPWNISGTITLGAGGPGVEGVTVSIGIRSATTDANADYTIIGVGNGTYTVTPTLTSHVFEPASRSVTVANGHVLHVDFIEPLPTYSIGGEILDQDGAALADITVEAYDAASQKVAEDTTAADGTYELSDLVAGDYQVVPTDAQYTFDPVQAAVQLTDQPVSGVDFVGTLITYTMSGRITINGEGLAGVQLSDGSRTATTDQNGDYAITGVASGTYTVTPTLQYHDFDPVSRSVTVSDTDVVDVNFTATAQLFTILGSVTDYNGDALAGVTVTDGTNTTTTNAAGLYTLTNVADGAVTITASKSGYIFDPDGQQITVPDTLTGVDFVGYLAPTRQFGAGVNLIGVPLAPLNTDPEMVFGTDQVARWNPQAQPPGYMMPGDIGLQELLRVQPGRGFFVNFTGVTDLSVGGTPVRTDRPFTIALGPLWNMVASPFLAALPMANVRPLVPGTVLPFAFIYDNGTGSYLLVSAQPGINIARTNLMAWEGAWVRTTGGSSYLEMTAATGITAADSTEMEPQALDVGDNGWIIPVVARVAGRCDLTSAVGVAPAVGTYTVPNPPRVPGSVDVYFIAEDGSQLAQAIKPAMTDQVSWDFVVATDIGDSDVDVVLPDLSQVPHQLSVILTDLDSGRSIYARTCPKYTFRSAEHGATRHLRLEVVPQGADNLAITTAAAQSATRGVVVTYSVTKPCEVTVKVMNISGRVIKTLATGQVANEGVNTQTWNLRNEAGGLVPGGLYLLQIRATAENGQRVSRLCQVNVAR